MKPVAEIYPLLAEPKRIIITMHQKPDGDAMGSTLGLYHFLKQFGHRVNVISPTNWADFLKWMPGLDLVMDYERKTAEADKLIADADWIFCLDFNVLNRTKKMELPIAQSEAKKILIDHHQQPQTEVFEYGVSDTSKSSTCEMVHDFIAQSPFADKVNLEVAECLYTGIMTDTGSFRFPSTSAAVHRIVADLLDQGMNHSRIHEEIFDTFSESRLRFFGNVFLNRLEVFYEFNTALMTIPHADLIKYDIKTGDTEGLVNYPLSIQGIKLAAIIIDRGEERKCSFRSKGDFDVNIFARKYFGGGGHMNASGGQSRESLDAARLKFIDAMKENKSELSTYNF